MNEIRTELNERLEAIRSLLLESMALVATRVDEVTEVLLSRDVGGADRIILLDDEFDLIAQQIEDHCIETLIREQPVASDLRTIVAAMHMNSDIERSGDLCANIAKAVGRMQGTQIDDKTRDLIFRMAEQAKILFERSVEAYSRLDAGLAKSIDELDDVLDDLHRDYIQVVISEAKHGEMVPQQSLQLALIGRFYERIGDHAENLGERIRYIVDGWTPEREGADRARARASAAEDLQNPENNTESAVRSRGLAVIESISEERRIDATRRDFVANVSHELKTPVGAVVLLAETMVDANDEERSRLIEHLNQEALRMESIIDDLLELTRLEEFDAASEPVSVDETVMMAVDLAKGYADARNIAVAVVGLPSEAVIGGEQRQIVRALVNLIDNAARYSEPGTQVSVTIDPLVDAVDISVTDTGVGIARPELERIFERFYRVDRARSRETGGTGLGLSIVRHVADNHGGRVVVDSKPGEGSTFTLQLPKTNPNLGAAGSTQPAAPSQAAETPRAEEE